MLYLNKNKKSNGKREIPSPCTGICSMDEKDAFCLGCYRTRDVIARWVLISDDEKRALIELIRERRKAARRERAMP